MGNISGGHGVLSFPWERTWFKLVVTSSNQFLLVVVHDIKGNTVTDVGGRRVHTPPMAQNFLNFMQFFGKIGNFICWRPPRTVGAPSYGESWIHPRNSIAYCALLSLDSSSMVVLFRFEWT